MKSELTVTHEYYAKKPLTARNEKEARAIFRRMTDDLITRSKPTLKPIESTNREATEVTVRGAKRERPEISGWRKAA